LLRAALGLVPLAAGARFLQGQAVASLDDRRRAELAAYLPQDRKVGWNLPAWRLVALGAPTLSPARGRKRALEALSQVGMSALAERGVLEMSGGERARVLLARLIATGAPVLFADEPAAGLDPAARFQMVDLLRRRVDAGATVVVTLHDLTLAARACDRVAVIAGGRLIALGPPSQALTPGILRDAFDLEGRIIQSEFGPILAARVHQPETRAGSSAEP
jgi:iron complex transport system ATP-binding protein